MDEAQVVKKKISRARYRLVEVGLLRFCGIRFTTLVKCIGGTFRDAEFGGSG